jgi:transaldolase
MKFFIDTAELSEIREANEMGILDGVTTNPSLVVKAGKPFKETIIQICNIVKGPVSIEVTATEVKAMLKEAHDYAKWSEYGVIKLPTTRDGVKACKALSSEGIKVNMTLCFSAAQALLVAKAGATYVSPFIGRVDDIAWDGMQLIRDIRVIYNNYGYKTQILAASLRHPMHVVECAKAGADVATMPFKVLEPLFHHPLTDKGLAQFLKDWEKAVKEEPVHA